MALKFELLPDALRASRQYLEDDIRAKGCPLGPASSASATLLPV